MKNTRLFILAMMAMVIVFSGCSKDDDDDFNIVGTWQQESFVMAVNFGVPGLDDFILADEEGEDVTITFNANGTGSTTDAEGTESFTWTLSGNILTISDDDMNMSVTLTTMTNSRIVGEQSMNRDEMQAMFEMDEEDMEIFENFPNLTAKLKIVLVR